MSSSLDLSTSTSEKRKKVSKKDRDGPWHQSTSVAISTTVTDDARPSARRRTEYIPTVVPSSSAVSEDTDTLAWAAQLDGFSYLLGDDVQQEHDMFDGADTMVVEVRNLPKRYDSTVCPFIVISTPHH